MGWRIELVRLASSRLERVGLQLWAGALVLCDFLLARPWLFHQRRVCELGAGPELTFAVFYVFFLVISCQKLAEIG